MIINIDFSSGNVPIWPLAISIFFYRLPKKGCIPKRVVRRSEERETYTYTGCFCSRFVSELGNWSPLGVRVCLFVFPCIIYLCRVFWFYFSRHCFTVFSRGFGYMYVPDKCPLCCFFRAVGNGWWIWVTLWQGFAEGCHSQQVLFLFPLVLAFVFPFYKVLKTNPRCFLFQQKMFVGFTSKH